MEDSRFTTDYVQNSSYESSLKSKNNISSNEDYRKFLVNNAQTIMNHNKQSALNQNVDMTFYNVVDKNHGSYIFNENSNATPHGYETNQTKELYLSRPILNNIQFKK